MSTIPGEIPPCVAARDPSATPTTVSPAAAAAVAPVVGGIVSTSIHWNAMPAACPACTKTSSKVVHPGAGTTLGLVGDPSVEPVDMADDDKQPRTCLASNFLFKSCCCCCCKEDKLVENRRLSRPRGGKCCGPVYRRMKGVMYHRGARFKFVGGGRLR